MALLDLQALAATPLETEPYEHLVVEGFVPKANMEAVLAGYPEIEAPGSFPLDTLKYDGVFADLIAELDGEGFRKLVEEKFAVDLTGKPTMFTARGRCQLKDGQIHTDSKTKIITVLLYLNEDWMKEGGKLRLLTNGKDLDAMAREVPPDFGTLLIFKRSENSWHGHPKYEGPRRVVQMNWVTSQDVVDKEQARHKVSAFFKRVVA